MNTISNIKIIMYSYLKINKIHILLVFETLFSFQLSFFTVYRYSTVIKNRDDINKKFPISFPSLYISHKNEFT